MKRPLSYALLLALVGCGSSRESGNPNVVGADDSGFTDEPSADDTAEGAIDSWRIDVFPASGTQASDREILPQSYSVTAGGTDLDLVLVPGVFVEGSALAYNIGPLASSALPGSDEPVAGTLSLRLEDTVQGRAVALDAAGGFSFDAVPASNYRLVVTPADASLPLYIGDVDLSGDIVLDLDLGSGSTLWGRIFDDQGRPMSGVDVRAVSALGPTTSTITTRDDGTYLLRVPPGSWTVEALGRGNGRDPKIESDPILVDEDGAGADLQYANLDTFLVGGRMIAATGPGVRDGVARFTAISLDGYDATASLVVEVPADDFGNFDTRLVPGRWHVELFPADDQALTPVDRGEIVVDGPIDLGDTTLSVAGNVTGTFFDPAGDPVAGALLECVEDAFGHRTWTLRSDDLGAFVGPMARVPVHCDLIPPGSRADLAQTPYAFDSADDDEFDLEFDSGILVEGQARYQDGGALRPLELALVEVRDAKGQLLGTALSRTGNGRFALRVVPAE